MANTMSHGNTGRRAGGNIKILCWINVMNQNIKYC